MDISQDPIKGVYQSSKVFWARVKEAYENEKMQLGVNLHQAKSMLSEDPSIHGGWKFDHVWCIIKNFEKFKDGVTPSKRVSIQCYF
ncbi:hypothetical protein AtEden1_Chr5g0119391 [Arabidopsis thaliana]